VSDFDILTQYTVWREQAFVWHGLDGLGITRVSDAEFIDAFLDSWHSAMFHGIDAIIARQRHEDIKRGQE